MIHTCHLIYVGVSRVRASFKCPRQDLICASAHLPGHAVCGMHVVCLQVGGYTNQKAKNVQLWSGIFPGEVP